LKYRERNEIYKTKSIGYKGEALNALSMVSELTIISKHEENDQGYKATYFNGNLTSLRPIECPRGTKV